MFNEKCDLLGSLGWFCKLSRVWGVRNCENIKFFRIIYMPLFALKQNLIVS